MSGGKIPQKAMVLAAGLGKRMRSYDSTIPKPMVKVAGKSLVDHALDLLAASGIPEAVVNISYLADLLEAHVKNRHQPKLHLSREDTPLETGGGIRKALPLLGPDVFVVMNSDVIVTDGPSTPLLQRLADAWNADAMDALLLVTPREAATGYEGQGDFHVSADGRMRRRLEGETAPFVFTGVQFLHPRLFAHAPAKADEPFSMNLLYNHGKDADGWLSPQIRAVVHDGMWLHVGDAAGVHAAEAKLRARA